MVHNTQQEWSQRLLRLGMVVQSQVMRLHQQSVSFERLAEPTREAAGDRIYGIDQFVEAAIEQEIKTWPDSCFPLDVVAEGFGLDGRYRLGHASVQSRFRLLMDPIDGTRMLMFDKRSAWFLAAVAESDSDASCLDDCFASVMVELPPAKQTFADAFVVTRGQPTHALRFDLYSRRTASSSSLDNNIGEATPSEIFVAPSSKATLRDGFLSVVSYFPGIKCLAAELTERIALSDPQLAEAPNIFDDQYISTGGQLVQLITGRDLCCIDLRPLMAQMPGVRAPVMSAHPYDLAGLLAAQAAGVIVTNGFGQPLNAPFDVTTPVHWCGYANSVIQNLVEPIVQSWLAEKGCVIDSASEFTLQRR